MIELYNAAVANPNIRDRVPLIHELQRKGLEEATFLLLVVPEFVNATNSRVKNWYIDFTGFNLALRTAWIEE